MIKQDEVRPKMIDVTPQVPETVAATVESPSPAPADEPGSIGDSDRRETEKGANQGAP
jgi:hypothetical protein